VVLTGGAMPSGALEAAPARPDQHRARGTRRSLGDCLRSFAVHDWIVLGYISFLNVAVALRPAGPIHDHCQERVAVLLVALVAALVVVRGPVRGSGPLVALAYRLAIYGTVQVSYFFFREMLPFLNPTSLDSELHGLGITLFGAEPALVLDHTVNATTTEWFAFFYFGYFFVLAVHVIPILLFSRSRRLLGEFTFGMLYMFCIGHTLYILVPGYGPYRAVAPEFQHALPDGLWLDVVMQTVSEGGALKDIFPSLHTAAPLFIALFSFRHRALVPFRYSWPIICFFSVNIIVATMFLRWHWIIDVVAGIALATSAQALSVATTNFELRRRAAEPDLGTSWPEYASTGDPAL
jgi:hypothetical protein